MKNSRKFWYIGGVLIAVLLGVFLWLNLRPQQAPPKIARNTKLLETLERQISLLGMELRVTNQRMQSEVERVINRKERNVTQLQGKEYEYLLQVKNLEPPKITIYDNRILLKVRIAIALHAVPIKKKGLSEEKLKKQAKIRLTGQGTFSFDWQIAMKPDWSIEQNLQWSNEWEKSPWLYYKGLYLPAASVIKSKLNEVINHANQSLATELSVLLRSKADEFWQSIQKPQLAYNKPKVWVSFIPQQISLPAFRNENNDLLWRFALSGEFGIWIEENQPQFKKVPLANLNIEPIVPNTFTLKLPILSNMNFLAQNMEKSIKQNLNTEQWQSLNASVSNLRIYPSVSETAKHDLVIEVTLGVRILDIVPISGKFYFIATPDWNSKTNTLIVSNVRWIHETQNILEQTFLTGLGEVLVQTLQEDWEISLQEKISEALENINKQISFVDTKNRVKWQNFVRSLEVSHLDYDTNYIMILVTLRGSLQAILF